MKKDIIVEIGIDSEERLYLKPSKLKFLYIYREAMEVYWNNETLSLYGAKPRKWSYLDWFKQIIRAVEEQSCKLSLNEKTNWVNIPKELKEKILNC